MEALFLFLVLSLSPFQHVAAEPPEPPVFLEVISDVTVAANGPPASMTCVAKAHNLYWRVNNTWYTHKHTDPLIRKGFAFSARYNATIAVVSGNVTISVSGEHRTNNNTVVKCRADRQPNDNTSISAVATLLIADVPLPPKPDFLMVNKSTVLVEWEAPFTWQDFPITNYTVEVINQSSGHLLANDVLGPDTYSYSLTQAASPKPCTHLLISVSATTEVGTSLSGHIYGSFPTPPGRFAETAVNRSVLFTAQGTPYLNIIFTLPILCRYNDATYSVIVTDDEGVVIVRDGPHFVSWRNSTSTVSLKLRLGRQADYTASVVVATLGGQSIASFKFSTNSKSGHSPVTSITAAASAVGVFILLSTVVIIMTIVLCIKKRFHQSEKSEKPGVLADSAGAGAIYEEIPGLCNVKHVEEREKGYASSGLSSDMRLKEMSQASDQCTWMDNAQEEAYMVMTSAGSLTTHDQWRASDQGPYTKNVYQYK